MDTLRNVQVFISESHRLHDPPIQVEAGFRDPMQETPARVEKIRRALTTDERVTFAQPGQFGRAPIEAVHDRAMVDYLEVAHAEWHAATGFETAIPDVFLHPGLRVGMQPSLPSIPPTSPVARLGYWCFDTTTPLAAGTYVAARGAVDTALSAIEAVLDGVSCVYGLCRPPGHHAAASVFGGYCFFNNAAIAAQFAAAHGTDRIAIVDVDYHHGNGTQQIFYDRGDVFYGSLHGDPTRAYPNFVGFADETGTSKGRGTNLNVPLAAGCDDATYLAELDRLLDSVTDFGAEILIVSLGLDLYGGDPLGDFAITTDGIRAVGAALEARSLPTVILQEGGYAIDDLGRNAAAFLDPFLNRANPAPQPPNPGRQKPTYKVGY